MPPAWGRWPGPLASAIHARAVKALLIHIEYTRPSSRACDGQGGHAATGRDCQIDP